MDHQLRLRSTDVHDLDDDVLVSFLGDRRNFPAREDTERFVYKPQLYSEVREAKEFGMCGTREEFDQQDSAWRLKLNNLINLKSYLVYEYLTAHFRDQIWSLFQHPNEFKETFTFALLALNKSRLLGIFQAAHHATARQSHLLQARLPRTIVTNISDLHESEKSEHGDDEVLGSDDHENHSDEDDYSDDYDNDDDESDSHEGAFAVDSSEIGVSEIPSESEDSNNDDDDDDESVGHEGASAVDSSEIGVSDDEIPSESEESNNDDDDDDESVGHEGASAVDSSEIDMSDDGMPSESEASEALAAASRSVVEQASGIDGPVSAQASEVHGPSRKKRRLEREILGRIDAFDNRLSGVQALCERFFAHYTSQDQQLNRLRDAERLTVSNGSTQTSATQPSSSQASPSMNQPLPIGSTQPKAVKLESSQPDSKPRRRKNFLRQESNQNLFVDLTESDAEHSSMPGLTDPAPPTNNQPPRTRRDSDVGMFEQKFLNNAYAFWVALTLSDKLKEEDVETLTPNLLSALPDPQALLSADAKCICKLLEHKIHPYFVENRLYQIARYFRDQSPSVGRFHDLSGVHNYPKLVSGQRREEALRGLKDSRYPHQSGILEIGSMPSLTTYKLDAWRIFWSDKFRGLAQDHLGTNSMPGHQPEWQRVLPENNALIAYIRWLWLEKENKDWQPSTGETANACCFSRNLRDEIHRIQDPEQIPTAICDFDKKMRNYARESELIASSYEPDRRFYHSVVQRRTHPRSNRAHNLNRSGQHQPITHSRVAATVTANTGSQLRPRDIQPPITGAPPGAPREPRALAQLALPSDLMLPQLTARSNRLENPSPGNDNAPALKPSSGPSAYKPGLVVAIPHDPRSPGHSIRSRQQDVTEHAPGSSAKANESSTVNSSSSNVLAEQAASRSGSSALKRKRGSQCRMRSQSHSSILQPTEAGSSAQQCMDSQNELPIESVEQASGSQHAPSSGPSRIHSRTKSRHKSRTKSRARSQAQGSVLSRGVSPAESHALPDVHFQEPREDSVEIPLISEVQARRAPGSSGWASINRDTSHFLESPLRPKTHKRQATAELHGQPRRPRFELLRLRK